MSGQLPSKEDLQQAWDDLRDIHAKYLQVSGVRIPNTKQYDRYAKSIWLSVLHYYANEEVHKDLISDVCQRDKSNAGRDQQVRHLKRDGWKLTGKQGYHCLDPYEPSPEWVKTENQRIGRVNAKTFDDIKNIYDYRCATCGAKEGHPSYRYGEDKVALQRGHKDPWKPDTKDNIIPQCQFCNRAYRGDFVFDNKGRVSAIADVRPVKRANKEVQKRVFAWLKKQFSS